MKKSRLLINRMSQRKSKEEENRSNSEVDRFLIWKMNGKSRSSRLSEDALIIAMGTARLMEFLLTSGNIYSVSEHLLHQPLARRHDALFTTRTNLKFRVSCCEENWELHSRALPIGSFLINCDTLGRHSTQRSASNHWTIEIPLKIILSKDCFLSPDDGAICMQTVFASLFCALFFAFTLFKGLNLIRKNCFVRTTRPRTTSYLNLVFFSYRNEIFHLKLEEENKFSAYLLMSSKIQLHLSLGPRDRLSRRVECKYFRCETSS